MDLFDLEREIAEVELLRVAFIRRRSPHPIFSYKKTFAKPLSRDSCEEELVERIITVVGHGIPFYVLSAHSARLHNLLQAADLELH